MKEDALPRIGHFLSDNVALPLGLFVMFLFGWEMLITALDVPQYTLPKPSAIWESFEGEWGDLLHHSYLTAKEAFLGFVIGNGVALILASFMSEFKVIEKSIYPYVLLLRSLPIVAVAPLLIIWFGFTIWPIVAAAALICFFPTLVNAVEGFKSTDPTTLQVMRVLNASRWQTFFYVKFPNALPYIFAALKIAVAAALIGAIVGEWIAADEGLGFLTIQANNFVDTLLLFRAIIAMTVLAVSWFLLVVLLEAYVLRWKSAGRA